jgi:DNA helicase-2/ATP-dependent DNA helicase PcrA
LPGINPTEKITGSVMKFIADFHIHSFYSRATSKELNFEQLNRWAQIKGIQVVGTGDISHPGWLNEMEEKLEPAEEGLFKLKSNVELKNVPLACAGPVRFILAGEISNIYKKHDKVRKIHNIVFLPSFGAVRKFQNSLEKIGNIRSDGRPILGLDARDLLEIVLETDNQAQLIPAHIWTPWFSLFGSKSGFDSIEQCFEDLTPHIFALETGLSSDPPMNWRLSALDHYTLISDSDAHSPQKLGREANLFFTELSYPTIFQALKSGDPQKFKGTVEFFPEEGKYHYDGHRKCGICWGPKTTIKNKSICPKCGKPVTIGVMHRVELLADRVEGKKPDQSHSFQSLIPLTEILTEIYGVGPSSKIIQKNYNDLVNQLGSELDILQNIPLIEIEKTTDSKLAEAIRRMRCGEVITVPGYDGEFGKIKLFSQKENSSAKQLFLFETDSIKDKPKVSEKSIQLSLFDLGDQIYPHKNNSYVISEKYKKGLKTKETIKRDELIYNSFYQAAGGLEKEISSKEQIESDIKSHTVLAGLNGKQREAVFCVDTPLVIVAGPGTGKTRTITHRIAYLILEKGILPENILAITFTNKAAQEMSSRLLNLLPEEIVKKIFIKTFHALGTKILREAGEAIGFTPNFVILSEPDRQLFFKNIFPEVEESKINSILENIAFTKNHLFELKSNQSEAEIKYLLYLTKYEVELRRNLLADYEDLVQKTVQLFKNFPETLKKYQEIFRWITVDEYQDVNYAQYCLLKMMTVGGTNLCVIGDPNQAIYGFRGADPKYFLKFQKDFPAAKVIRLNKNYRSTTTISDASTQIITSKIEVVPDIRSENIYQSKIEIYQASTEKAEAEFVVEQIEKMVGGTSYFSLDSGRVSSNIESTERSFSDFAVLYRVKAQSYALIKTLNRSGIPFQTMGQLPFFENNVIKRIISCLWFIHNPASLYAIAKVENLQKNILEKLLILKNTDCNSVGNLIEQIYEIVFKNRVGTKKNDLVKKLILKAIPFENRLGDFLGQCVLSQETDEYDAKVDRVALLTLHAAKGLEFPVVFIVGCEENLLPFRREAETCVLEEERRLLYVGMTRAQHILFLTHSKSRFIWGKKCKNQPSQFLENIKEELKNQKESFRKNNQKKKNKPEQLTLF